jgi:hypothetical protein
VGVLGVKVLATARLSVSSRAYAPSINPLGGESAQFSFDAEDATDDGASSNELILGRPGLPILEKLVLPCIARPGESTLQEKLAVATWQDACDACFAEAAVSIGTGEGSADPIPANFQDVDTAPQLAAGCVALLGGLWHIGRDMPRRQWLPPQKRRSPEERRRSLRYPCHLRTYCRLIGTGLTESRSALAWDLSASGVNLVLSRPFLPGSLLTVELEGPGQRIAPWLMMRVVHVSERVPGEWVLGCAFERQLADSDVQNLLLGVVADSVP